MIIIIYKIKKMSGRGKGGKGLGRPKRLRRSKRIMGKAVVRKPVKTNCTKRGPPSKAHRIKLMQNLRKGCQKIT